ncbi:hypothetical protein Tco_1345660 [Tanacetum coccineum]
MTSRKRRTLFPKVVIQMDTDTDDDDEQDLDVQKKFDEFDDEIECESKIEDFKGKNICTPIVGKKKLNNGSNFSPVVFYGSPKGVRPKRQSRLLRLLDEICIELEDHHKSTYDIWATFPTQEEAMNYGKEFVGIHIFSYQDHVSGQRRFLVSTYKEFWRRYKNMNCKFRHHYEVIQEGMPCHLYFDLEFNIKENAKKNGDEMIDILILIIFECLLEKYSIEGNINCPADSGYMFIDTAVYSKNRCFRLHLSSKAGKNSVLLPTGRFKCKEMSEEDVFMLSLICNVEAECEKLITCNMDIGFINVFKYDTKRNHEYCKRRTHNFSRKSPFPKIDQFIEYISTIGEVKGKIQSWYWFLNNDYVLYNSKGIDFVKYWQEHKSNHVMYVVDLQRNVYYQKCYGPDCRGYRSPFRAVPPDVMLKSFRIGEQNESQMDRREKDDWWLEAMLVAKKVENKPRNLVHQMK